MFYPGSRSEDPGATSNLSNDLFTRGRKVFPDGTTRITVERNPLPRYIARGEGAYLLDVDGNRFLDLNNNFTTLIHGHGFAPVLDAVGRAVRNGTCFSNPTAHEIDLAELLVDRIPSVEHVRFVNTGTEAIMFAVKAARALTGRPAIAKIEGAYHGAYDWAEVSQSSVPANWGNADEPEAVPVYEGMPASVLNEVVVLNFNDIDGARRLIRKNANRLAGLLIDPMPSRAGLIAPDAAFLKAITEVAREHGIVIIADEVLNLRQGYHGACSRYGIEPDLLVMGKIIGGGFPVGAIGGTRTAMRVFSAEGKAKLPQGGTFSANPVSMIAGLVSMQQMTPERFEQLELLGQRLRSSLEQVIDELGAAFSVTGAASLFRIHPKKPAPSNFRETCSNPEQSALMRRMSRFFLEAGIVLPEGAAACLSTTMGETEIARIVEVFTRFIESSDAEAERVEHA